MASILPDKLYSKQADGLVSTSDALQGAEYIGVYFSAHWCPPCRQFTPILSAWNTKHSANKNMKLVFASNDKNEKEMKSYFGEMSFDLAIPHDHPAISKLGSKFKVQGIPTLVILDKEGNVVTTDGRTGIIQDAEGAKFPYRPPTVEGLLKKGGDLVDASGATTPVDAVLSKTYLALYFSAHWCPPCRGFTPKAAAWYKSFKASGKPFSDDFEVVFVSSDKDQASFDQYLGEMPWKALPLDKKEVKAELSRLYEVQGIPTMILLKKGSNGAYQVETRDLRTKIESDPDNFPWPPKALSSIDEVVDDINDYPHLLAFTDKLTDSAAEQALVASMESVAGEYFKNGELSDALRFAVAKEEHDSTEQVRQFVGAAKDKDGPTSVRIVIVDVQAQGKLVMPLPDGRLPTTDEIKTFAADYVGGKLKVKPFRE